MTDAAIAATPERNSWSPWPGRVALWTVWAAIPLFLFGGAVTTMRAGMAEDGWLTPNGYLLWLYPWEMRIANAGVFVEHHHRELGSLVGMLAILTVLTTFILGRGAKARLVALLGLISVSIQGAVGGFRVLENSPDLAFLHGFLGQVVFAVLAGIALYLSRPWAEAKSLPAEATSLRGLAWGTVALALTQVLFGAWFRHRLEQNMFVLHIVGAVAMFYVVTLLARRLRSQAADPATPVCLGAQLKRTAKRLTILLHSQVLLGILAAVAIYVWSGGMESQTITRREIVFATLHVLIGALLLATCVHAALWSGRRTEGLSR